MNLTLEEQERRAYADGDTERAALLRIAIDAIDPPFESDIEDEEV